MNKYATPIIWRGKHPLFKNNAPQKLQNWLTGTESLTHALRLACPNQFSVRVLQESWQKPTKSERDILGLSANTLAFVRQVYLFCGSQPWVYARTVIPKETLHGELQKLTHLGSQPLGEILFDNSLIQRSRVEFTRIQPKHRIYQAALQLSPITTQEVWGRRSLFHIAKKTLIVNEFFLPNIHTKKQKSTCTFN